MSSGIVLRFISLHRLRVKLACAAQNETGSLDECRRLPVRLPELVWESLSGGALGMAPAQPYYPPYRRAVRRLEERLLSTQNAATGASFTLTPAKMSRPNSCLALIRLLASYEIPPVPPEWIPPGVTVTVTVKGG